MKQKKFNIIDVIALVLIIAVVGFVGYKVLNARSNVASSSTVETMDVTYVAKVEAVDADLADNIQQYIPSQLMASGELFNGYIVAAESEPYLELSSDGQWVAHPEKVNLYLTVEATIATQGVMTTEIANQELRLGRKANIVKTEYIEFSDCLIVDVQWN